MKTLILAVLFLAGALPAYGTLIVLESRQTALASICTDGTVGCAGGVQSQISQGATNGHAEKNNFDGSSTSNSEARTAARVGAFEIAANSTIRHRTGGPFANYTSVEGDAIFEIDMQALTAGHVYLDFFLPPGFVEIETNVELFGPSAPKLAANIQADIQLCRPACPYSTLNPGLFQMYAELIGGFDSYSLLNNATAIDPALDLSPLEHSNVSVVDTVTNYGPIRTRTWEYGAFSGRLDLGHFAAGETFTVSYRMSAESANGEIFGGYFPTFLTWAAAAINDPFFLASDPVTERVMLNFEFVPNVAQAPEPATLLMIGPMVMLLFVIRRRRSS